MRRKHLIPQNHEAKIKYVKKASRWCLTTFIKGQQKQEWFATEKEAQQELDDKYITSHH